MFWLNNKGSARKISCIDKENTLSWIAENGPCFGNGDLRIQADNTLNFKFPTSFNDNMGEESKLTRMMMTGDPENNSCKYLDYEVYQLEYEK